MEFLKSQDLAIKLRSAGYKATPQRLLIYEVLASTREHPTAESIYNIIHPTHPNISFATVYKALDVLSDIGVVRRLNTGEVSTRFDVAGQPHSHAQCLKCGKVFDVYNLSADVLENQVAAQIGMNVKNHEFYFFGICNGCSGKN